MATPKVVTGLLKGPDNLPRAGFLTIKLSQATTIPGVQETLPSALDLEIPATGVWPAVSLYANNDLTPNGTYYTVTETTNDGAVYTRTIVVPQTAGPFAVTSIETAPPTLAASPSRVSTLIVDGAATFTAGPVTVSALGLGIVHASAAGLFSSSLIVDADVTAVGVAKLTGTTLPAGIIASSLTSVGVLAALTVTATITGSVSGSSGSATGNALTATTLQTARAINGVNFDGSAAITVAAAAGTLTGAALAAGVTASSLTSVGILASPHMTAPVVDSGGLTVSAGGAAIVGNGKLQVGATSPGAFHNLDSIAGQTTVLRLRQGDFPRYRSDWVVSSGGLSISAFDDTAGVYMPVGWTILGLTVATQGTGGAGDILLGLGSASSYLRLTSGASTLRINPADSGNTIYNSGADMVLSSGGAIKIFGATQGVLIGQTAAALIGFYNHAPVVQPAAPVTLADVIAVLRGNGLSA